MRSCCLSALLLASSALASPVSFSSSNKPHRSAPVFSPAFFNIFDADGDEMLTFRELTDGFTKEGMFEGQVVEQAETGDPCSLSVVQHLQYCYLFLAWWKLLPLWRRRCWGAAMKL